MDEYRKLCSQYIPYIRTLKLPSIRFNEKKEAVFIEFRDLPHLEFIVRNAIHKLGEGWSHTIVCGTLNDHSFKFTESIPNVRIIKTRYSNLTQNQYSEFLCTKRFWEFFRGEKILIYQEDSCIFKDNMNDYVRFDYIGAPYSNIKSTKYVGNGGISLRTKACMLEVIEKQPLQTFIIPVFTQPYCKKMGLRYCPEDVYFSTNMQELNIGVVADWESAHMFSTEGMNNLEATCGHKFWQSNPLKKMMCKVIRQVKIPVTMYHPHCGGWNDVLKGLMEHQIVAESAPIHLLDMVERFFIWNKNFLVKPIDIPWIGIVHYTPKTAPYSNSVYDLFENDFFIKSLPMCKGIICLSQYVKDCLDDKLTVPIHVIHHPVHTRVKRFNYEKYKMNPNKYLLQIGNHLRRVSSIYKVNAPFHKKMWLTGSPQKMDELLHKDVRENKVILNKSVSIRYVNPDVYHHLLTENIVFIDLYDSSANNVILECIVRRTPILLNRTSGAIEYLGPSYPLFYDTFEEIPDLLSPVKIIESMRYLEALKPLSIKSFCEELLSIIYSI